MLCFVGASLLVHAVPSKVVTLQLQTNEGYVIGDNNH